MSQPVPSRGTCGRLAGMIRAPVAAILLAGAPLHAQTVTLSVFDSLTGTPVAGAVAELSGGVGPRRQATADSAGIVRLQLGDARLVTIQRFGYYPAELDAGAISGPQHVVRLRPNPTQLSAIAIQGRDPYQILNPAVENLYARRHGRTQARARILVRGDHLLETSQTVEDLRERIFRRPLANRRSCRGPLWFLNGFAYPNVPWGTEFDDISLALLEGIEFYMNPLQVPAEYWRGGSECGVIALWTRR
jgi:hypothetical protein